MSRYTITENTLTGLADAIREVTHTKGTMTPSQMKNRIKDINLQYGVELSLTDHMDPTTGKWVRP